MRGGAVGVDLYNAQVTGGWVPVARPRLQRLEPGRRRGDLPTLRAVASEGEANEAAVKVCVIW